jgi:TfoX/Sxy family transcriptional regulator of competence genes
MVRVRKEPHDSQCQAVAADLGRRGPPDLHVTFRPMFGGLFAYADDQPFASLSDVGSALKIADNERDAMLALPGIDHFAMNQISWPANPVSS